MLELIGSGLMSMWLEMAGVQVKPLDPLDVLTWQSSPSLILAPDPSPAGVTTVQEYFKGLLATKIMPANLTQSQGIWLQSGPMLMANHQGTTPLPAASLTKIATSLVALKAWGAQHQFETIVGTTGSVQKGVLQGDLIITGGGDPLFVWEEAIALGNTLNKMGIKQIKGNLIISGNFAMNFQRHPLLAGQALKQALNHKTWSRATTLQYSLMPKGTPKPEVKIAGTVKFEAQTIPQQTLLVRRRSLPLHQLIKEMNVFSNNEMAQMLAELVGGHTVVQSTAARLARVPESEIQLINGSGLGVENRISPRAACAMLMAIQREALTHGLNLADLFPTSGFDRRGTLHARHMPAGTVMKTGTLNDVSALAGVIPTRDRGLVWFTIINRGPYVLNFRAEQDKLLQNLTKQLQAPSAIPKAIAPHSPIEVLPKFGTNERNEILYKS
ncbi:D-alanyl-D-alanine carboxypeptidase [Chlorogloeopsis sp. ULAP01]|uniref:D-alanyl-D-alanine carboxypeptidase n=1 Tax=Chlorogloeopsis sp. ULAP01 TaxID=3056483 RepID=UPI0025AB17F0|nr:D-alanyl-D-alanine carboxypeptidase [Chlorogloeopsis sp. ULAP01]MDM9385107.1 D-alanyl-D-alanine carboxypeptidase [Chlorogloeopsis sp. ULAP01]